MEEGPPIRTLNSEVGLEMRADLWPAFTQQWYVVSRASMRVLQKHPMAL